VKINQASRRNCVSALGVLAAVSILVIVFVPIWSVVIPPLADYPNHLARGYILANLPASTDLKEFYQANWSATPYLAMDAIVTILSRFTSIEISGKIFLSLTLLLLAIAPLALSVALNRQVTPIALLGLLFAHNTTLSLGFVNYLFSLGFAVCLLSLWIWLRESRPWVRLILFPVLTSLLFMSHLMGFIIYALTIVAYELGRHVEQVRSRLPRAPLLLDSSQRLNLISIGVQFSVPLVIFWLYGPSSETTDAIRQTTYGGIWRKIDLLTGIFSYLIPPYMWTLDRILTVALPCALVLLLAMRRLEVASRMWLPLFALLLLFFAMPMEWLGGWGGDHRLLPAIGVFFVGSLRPKVDTAKIWSLVAGLIVLLIVVRAAAITMEWRKADQEYAEYLQSFELLTTGSKVYYAFGHDAERNIWRPKYFLPCLAVITKQVYVPYLFTSNDIPGIPLEYRPAYYQLERLSPGPILVNRQSPNWEAIVDQYDYFILGNEHHFVLPVPPRLVQVYKGNNFNIYRNSNEPRHGTGQERTVVRE
jgi:hypothetical protein